MTKSEFACEKVLNESTDAESDNDDYGHVPNFGDFESKKANYTKNLTSEKFDEPRMFTMKQIRNMTMSMIA